MKTRTEFMQYCAVQGVPFWAAESLTRYLYDRRAPGHFLTAVLENNLLETVRYADADSMAALRSITVVLWNAAPIGTYGSPQAVERHLTATA